MKKRPSFYAPYAWPSYCPPSASASQNRGGLIGTDDRRAVLPVAMSVGVGYAVLENTVILI